MVKSEIIDKIELDGGRLCLDFVNTVANRVEDPPPDYLQRMNDFIAWGLRLGIISHSIARHLAKRSEASPKEAADFLKETIAFREILYTIFSKHMRLEKIPAAIFEKYNAVVRQTFAHIEIKNSGSGFIEYFNLADNDYNQILSSVVNDSYEFLLSKPAERLKSCPSCGWLFYDSTKNGRRRWCSMKSCGSNAKALEWYRRTKAEGRSA
ncbi:CGNR zinc finger domain-containing protein [Pollutibacter soli]|uniref:CGNR zinc finger domain-containing protein n=1 Tax=Pollutibacter soli TaxID=3034157 RepID=UPI0030139EA6